MPNGISNWCLFSVRGGGRGGEGKGGGEGAGQASPPAPSSSQLISNILSHTLIGTKRQHSFITERTSSAMTTNSGSKYKPGRRGTKSNYDNFSNSGKRAPVYTYFAAKPNRRGKPHEKFGVQALVRWAAFHRKAISFRKTRSRKIDLHITILSSILSQFFNLSQNQINPLPSSDAVRQQKKIF